MSQPSQPEEGEWTAEELWPETPEERAKREAEASAYLQWYNPILDECLGLSRKESVILQSRSLLGKRIISAKKQLKGLVDQDGWAGKLGSFMHQLATDLHLGQSTLYYCVAFAKKFETFEDFGRESFDIKRVSQRQDLVMNDGRFQPLETPAKVLGKELTWKEVCRFVVPKKKAKSRKANAGQADSGLSLPSIEPTSPSAMASPGVYVPLTEETERLLKALAAKAGKNAARYVADLLEELIPQLSKAV